MVNADAWTSIDAQEVPNSSHQVLTTVAKLKRVLQALALGQILAICTALSGVFNQLITNHSKEPTPASQATLTYILLCLTYGIYQLHTKGISHHFSKMGLKCLVNAIIDVEAWYWIYNAYNYTSLTSIQSLDCISIPVVIILSKCFLSKEYNRYQYAAVLLSLCGVVTLIYSDYDPQNHRNTWGDLMCIVGAVLFGVGTVCQEWILQEVDIYHYMGTVCWYATLISMLRVACLEWTYLIDNLSGNSKIAVLMACLAVSQFAFYSTLPIMLSRFGAGTATINTLSADMYATMAGYLLFNMHYEFVYIMGMLLICLGILMYVLKTEPVNEEYSDVSTESLMEDGKFVGIKRTTRLLS